MPMGRKERSGLACHMKQRIRATTGGGAAGLLSERLVQEVSEPDAGLLQLLLHDRHVLVDVRLIDPHVAVRMVAAMVMHDTVLGRNALGDLEGLVGPLFGVI